MGSLATLKICRDCGVQKPLSEFYRHPEMADGHLGSCKSCRLEYTRIRRITYPEIVREVDKKRNKKIKRQEHLRSNAERWNRLNPKGYKAHYVVHNAIRDGKLKRQYSCQSCGSKNNIHAHHHDYSTPLDVVWLCAACHAKEKYR